MRMLTICEVGLMVFPFLLTQFLMTSSSSEGEQERIRRNLWMATGLNLMLNLAVLMTLNRIFFHLWRFWRVTMRLLRMTASYQDVGRMGIMLFVWVLVSVPLAWGLRRFVLLRGGQTMSVSFSRGQKGWAALILTLCGMVAIAAENTAYHSEDLLRITEVYRKTVWYFLDTAETAYFGESSGELVAVRIQNDGVLENIQHSVWLTESSDGPAGSPVTGVSVPAGGSAWILMDFDLGPDLDKDGGSILCLWGQNGRLADSVVLPALAENQGYRRTGESWSVVQTGTARLLSADIPVPAFSRESGYYDEAFDLSLEAEEGLTIHYTLDCSEPTADSPIYQQPIRVYDRSEEPNQFRSIRNVRADYLNFQPLGETPVPKAFVVRAAAADTKGHISKTVTKVYMIGQETFRNSHVICLTADPEDLFGAKDGIYVTGEAYDTWYEAHLEEARKLPRSRANANTSFWAEEPTANYLRTGILWERAADIIIFNEDSIVLDQRVGIRIQGAAARAKPLKRFSIYARDQYSGSRLFDEPIFRGKRTHSLYLRQGVLNALSQRLAEGREVLIAPFRAVDVFVNGEFWYRSFLFEKMDETLVANTYDVLEANVAIAKNADHPSYVKGENNRFRSINAFVEDNDPEDEDYYRRFSEIIDMRSFIDCYCFQVYLANTDHSNNANTLMWHTRLAENEEYGDTRWRCGLYDMDLVWSSTKDKVEHYYEIDPFTTMRTRRGKEEPLASWTVFNALQKNAEFRRQYAVTFMDLVNTTFQPDDVLPILEELGDTEESYREFFIHRAEYAVPYLANAFGLSGELGTVTLESNNPEAGKVKLNTIQPDLSGGAWSGEYFTDYPVTVTAEAAPGYVFSGWLVNGAERRGETAEIPFGTEGVSIRAVFDRE